jgi:excisionase family DNA binding protein
MKHNRLVYSVEEAARLLRISRSHAYSLTETGQLPYIKLGKCKRITVEGSACSNCDATVSESAKFCPECGGLGRFVFAQYVKGFWAAGPLSIPAKCWIYPSWPDRLE